METTIDPKQITKSVIIALIVVFALIASFNMFENLDANEVMIIQNPISGDLSYFFFSLDKAFVLDSGSGRHLCG